VRHPSRQGVDVYSISGKDVDGLWIDSGGLDYVRFVDDLAEISEDLAEIVMRAEENPDYVLYGTFHTFNHHNA
jgi:hypothetical protein